MQINLTGFLNGKKAREFMGELWHLLISAQNSDDGIPQELVNSKKEEIKKRQVCSHQTFISYFSLSLNFLIFFKQLIGRNKKSF
jgi:hypothetical protein